VDRIRGRRSFRRIVFVGDRVLQRSHIGVSMHLDVFIRNAFPWLMGYTPTCRVVRTSEMALCTSVMLEETAPRSTALASRDIERQLGSTARTWVTRAAGNDHIPTLAPISTN